jgi:hypothetical protein
MVTSLYSARRGGESPNHNGEVMDMEIAYIVAVALVAVVAILANRNTKK